MTDSRTAALHQAIIDAYPAAAGTDFNAALSYYFDQLGIAEGAWSGRIIAAAQTIDSSIDTSAGAFEYLLQNPSSIATFLLNEYGTNAVAAWSLTKLSSTYTGDCIRVRRSSDNAEADIGFSGNALDETALLAHVGAGDGFIVTAYDQTGNTNHFTQATAGSQPRIVSSGVVDKQDGNPAAFHDGTDDRLQSPSMAIDSFFGNFWTSSNSGAAVSFDSSGNRYAGRWENISSTSLVKSANTTVVRFRGVSYTTGVDNRTAIDAAITDGEKTVYSSVGENRTADCAFFYNNGGAPTFTATGYVQSFIVYSANQSSNQEAIEALL